MSTSRLTEQVIDSATRAEQILEPQKDREAELKVTIDREKIWEPSTRQICRHTGGPIAPWLGTAA